MDEGMEEVVHMD